MLDGLGWYATGLSSLRSSLHERARRDFAGARRKAFLLRVGALLLRREPGSSELLSFEQVKSELGAVRQADLGIQSVPVSKIVGSVGRHGDFDGAFLPKKGYLRERWQGISRMLRQGGAFSPVSLYKIGDSYFVLDGNHRVSVASYHGIGCIDAEVIEFRGPSAPKPRPPAPRKHRHTRQGRGRSRDRRRPYKRSGPPLDRPARRAGEENVTLLFGAKDTKHNNARALEAFVGEV